MLSLHSLWKTKGCSWCLQSILCSLWPLQGSKDRMMVCFAVASCCVWHLLALCVHTPLAACCVASWLPLSKWCCAAWISSLENSQAAACQVTRVHLQCQNVKWEKMILQESLLLLKVASAKQLTLGVFFWYFAVSSNLCWEFLSKSFADSFQLVHVLWCCIVQSGLVWRGKTRVLLEITLISLEPFSELGWWKLAPGFPRPSTA